MAVVKPQSSPESVEPPNRGEASGTADSTQLARTQPWWYRTCSPEDRRRVMDDLAIRPVEHWIYRFGVMLTLSVIVAVMGLELNSAAVVIGAMLLAPLMQPVLATGACLSMALFVKALGAGTKVILATAWCIGLAYVIARLLPEQAFTAEVISRTKPDIRDLVVALAAGAGGAYATVREDASASLPGVAVAVALVPPLGAVGITLAAGHQDRAVGAMLLYTTNLAAIIFASIVVFIVTGFVPPRRLASTLPGLALAAVVAAGLVVVIATPLYQASVTTIQTNNELAQVESIVDSWLDGTDLQKTVRFEEGIVSVELRGFSNPPDQVTLEAELAQALPDLAGPPLVQWIRTERATTTTTTPPAPDAQLQQAIVSEVEEWLDASGIEYQLDNVSVNEGAVRIDAAGAGEPPSLVDLNDRLAALADGLSPRLNWSFRETIELDDEVVSPLELVTESVEIEVGLWADQHDLGVRSIDYDGHTLAVEVVGPEAPSIFDLRRLEDVVDPLDEDGYDLRVFFTERIPVTTTVFRRATAIPE